MSRDHVHVHHSHGSSDFSGAFAIGVVLNVGYVIAQIVFGIIAHSLALLADAGHNFGDVLGLPPAERDAGTVASCFAPDLI